jgi:hypothetical protein
MTFDAVPDSRTLATRFIWRTWATIALSLAALPAAAQNQLWIQQYGTSDSDIAWAAAPDSTGGVYLGGQTHGSLGGPYAGGIDAWLARHDGTGNQLWIRQLGTIQSDAVNAASPDGSGGVFVTGNTFGSLGASNAGWYDAWLAHYDGAGNQLWIRQLGTDATDYAYAAAPDESGGVYVSGFTAGSLGGPNVSPGRWDAWLARYDSAGNQLWIRQLGTRRDDGVEAAATDGSGGVYVSGWTTGSLGAPIAVAFDAWLARYDNAGNRIWIRQLGSGDSEISNTAAPDGAGGVYVGGYTWGSLGAPNLGATDAWLMRYDGAGNRRWIRQLGTSGGDDVEAATADGSGGVYVTGRTTGSLSGPNVGSNDVWLARFDSAGNQQWIDQLGTSGNDGAFAASTIGTGGVYVSGYTAGSLGGPNVGPYDVWLARYD